jgi:hypothetical protein
MNKLKTNIEYRMLPCGRKRKICQILLCTNTVQRGLVCMKHGAVPTLCQTQGCGNHAVKNGVCVRHGAIQKRCKVQGCKYRAQIHLLCSKHGAIRKRCKIQGCESHIQHEGYCTIHHPLYIPIERLSRGAKTVSEYLLNIQLPFETEKRYSKCKNIRTLPFDFFIPIYNLLIEYDGIQHTKPNQYWGGQQAFELL